METEINGLPNVKISMWRLRVHVTIVGAGSELSAKAILKWKP